MQQSEYFTYKCPHCANVRNAADVAAELPDEILRLIYGRRNARRRRTHAPGSGRPLLARCPGCAVEMTSAELREHRIPCIKQELKKALGMSIQLTPKDPDPYPAFYINRIDENHVIFEKASNSDNITVDLRKIAEITILIDENMAYIRLLGRIAWHDDIKRWRFEPTNPVGRPPQTRQESS